MTTKESSRKQVIILMSKINSNTIVSQENVYDSNINRLLKDVKFEVSADFICFDNKKIIITTKKAIASSNLNIIKRYIKELKNINLNNVMSPQLFQSKLYLKILEIPYYLADINSHITFDMMEKVIKNIYIFDNNVLVSHPCIIKVSPKSDILLYGLTFVILKVVQRPKVLLIVLLIDISI